ncbi:unnamed protein product [Effrenium voratum]|nr:unnamed protein product [Effrenium voratum]
MNECLMILMLEKTQTVPSLVAGAADLPMTEVMNKTRPINHDLPEMRMVSFFDSQAVVRKTMRGRPTVRSMRLKDGRATGSWGTKRLPWARTGSRPGTASCRDGRCDGTGR